jgi:glutamyl-tRNA reductase
LNGQAAPFGAWDQQIVRASVIVRGTSAPHCILDRARLEPLMRRRQDQLLLLIDLGVPRNIEPAVRLLESVYLYDMDDRQAMATAALRQRQTELTRCEVIVAEKIRALELGKRGDRANCLARNTNANPATDPGWSRSSFGKYLLLSRRRRVGSLTANKAQQKAKSRLTYTQTVFTL